MSRKLHGSRPVFQEDEQERTQEFVLRWSPDGGQSYREIVRQQYNFSPPQSRGTSKTTTSISTG